MGVEEGAGQIELNSSLTKGGEGRGGCRGEREEIVTGRVAMVDIGDKYSCNTRSIIMVKNEAPKEQ